MPRPRINPISPEAAAAGQAALDSFNNVFVPEGADTFATQKGTGRRWAVRGQIERARVEMGGTKDQPNESIAVYYLMFKALPFPVQASLAVPVGTTYHLRIRVDYDKVADGDAMAIRNEATLTSLFSALGVKISEGVPVELIEGAFPEKGSEGESTLLGQRVIATLTQTPGDKGTFLNVDRFTADAPSLS
jgi:hypothetical protein